MCTHVHTSVFVRLRNAANLDPILQLNYKNILIVILMQVYVCVYMYIYR